MSLNVALVTRAAAARAAAATWQLGRHVVAMATADSTMLVAKRALGLLPPTAADAESSTDNPSTNPRPANLHGTVFVADEQSAGVGRRGRSWQSGRGSGLYFTFVWSHGDSEPFRTAVMLNFATPLAVVEALHAVGVGAAQVKWPNDAWVDGRKICGMLVDNEAGVSIVGVGINLVSDHLNADDDLARTATSVAHELHRDSFDDRELLLGDILSRIDHSMREESLEQVLARYSTHHMLADRVIRVHHKTREESDDRDYDARVLGLSPFGFLRVRRLADDAVVELSGEEVTIRPQADS
jgi:BirA family biotin operon repressor/biotin-[acetyl-CoA-carboxylase] ligase